MTEKKNMPSTQFKVRTTDMVASEATFVAEAASIILEKVRKENMPKKISKKSVNSMDIDDLLCAFVQGLKLVLDKRFGAEWTVIGGLDFGFSLKSRKKSAIVIDADLLGKNFQVVSYRSPGHEIFGNAIITEIAQRKIRAEASWIGNFSEQISDLVKNVVLGNSDHQIAAQKLRESVSAATETSIWHVLVGTNFRVALPAERCDEFSFQRTPTSRRVLLFRHQQDTQRKLLSYLPMVSKLAMVLFCLTLLFQTRLGFSEKIVQVLGLAVLALAVMKVLYVYIIEKRK